MVIFKKLVNHWWIIVLPILVVICLLIAFRVVNTMNYHHTDNDFFTFWLAGHLVTQGQSPYDTVAWIAGYHHYEMDIIPNAAFLYPLPLAIVFAPLGWLAFNAAYITWVTLIQLMIVTSLGMLLMLATSRRSILFFITILASIVLFRPTILTLTQGQVSALFLLLLACMALLLGRGKWFLGGFLLGLLVLKPNLGIFIVVLLIAWSVLHGRWSALAGVATSCLILLLAGLVYRPNWLIDYWKIGSNKLAQTFGGSPTVWGLGTLVCNRNTICMFTFGGIASLLLVLAYFWLIVRQKNMTPAKVLALVVTITLLITPYTWTYDQLLLIIPISLVTLAIDRLGGKPLLTASIFPVIDVLVLLLLFFDVSLHIEILNVFVPMIILGISVWFLPQSAT